MDTSEYLGLFLDESRESLQALNASLLDLERDPADPEPLTVIFRVAHSLKGMSATMGFEAMARLTHRMEEVLAAMRDDGAPVTPADHRRAVRLPGHAPGDGRPGRHGRRGEEVDASAVLERLDAISDGAPPPPRRPRPPPPPRRRADHALSEYDAHGRGRRPRARPGRAARGRGLRRGLPAAPPPAPSWSSRSSRRPAT